MERNAVYGVVLICILVVIGLVYFIGQTEFARPAGMSVDSPDACRYACELEGYDGGDCKWPTEAKAEYYELGPCFVPYSKHCGNPDQCNCYCWSHPEFCSDVGISIIRGNYDTSSGILNLDVYNSGTVAANLMVSYRNSAGEVVSVGETFPVAGGATETLDISGVEAGFTEVFVEFPVCPDVRDSRTADRISII